MRYRYLALLLATGACNARPGLNPMSSPAEAASRDLFPLHLASFDRGDSTVYDDPNLGISYRYQDSASGATADVYRYPVELGLVCTGRCLSEVVEDEVSEFKRQIPLFIQYHRMDSAVVIGMRPAPVPETSWLETGRRFELRVFRSGEWNHSDLWLFAGRGVKLKVRATSPESRSAPGYDAMVRELIRSAGPDFTCPLGNSREQTIQISSTQKVNPDSMVQAITSALDSLGYSRHFFSPSHGVWASGPRFEPLRIYGNGPRNEVGVGVAVRLGMGGDSVSMVVMSRALCQSAGNDKNASTLAMTAALELTNRISGK
jgi:hypothetical protein